MKIEYPKWVYHAKEEPQVVASKDEHAKLGKEWCEKPCEGDKAAEQEASPEAKPKAPKGKKAASEPIRG